VQVGLGATWQGRKSVCTLSNVCYANHTAWHNTSVLKLSRANIINTEYTHISFQGLFYNSTYAQNYYIFKCWLHLTHWPRFCTHKFSGTVPFGIKLGLRPSRTERSPKTAAVQCRLYSAINNLQTRPNVSVLRMICFYVYKSQHPHQSQCTFK